MNDLKKEIDIAKLGELSQPIKSFVLGGIVKKKAVDSLIITERGEEGLKSIRQAAVAISNIFNLNFTDALFHVVKAMNYTIHDEKERGSNE